MCKWIPTATESPKILLTEQNDKVDKNRRGDGYLPLGSPRVNLNQSDYTDRDAINVIPEAVALPFWNTTYNGTLWAMIIQKPLYLSKNLRDIDNSVDYAGSDTPDQLNLVSKMFSVSLFRTIQKQLK